MKINKPKNFLLILTFCCLISALWSRAQCMQDDIKGTLIIKNIDRFENPASGGYGDITFNSFRGYTSLVDDPVGTFVHRWHDDLAVNRSTIFIPEDGAYSLAAHFFWQGNAAQHVDGPYTAIAINDAVENTFCKRHTVLNGNWDDGYITRVAKLRSGDRVSLKIRGAGDNASYNLRYFSLYVEKIS